MKCLLRTIAVIVTAISCFAGPSPGDDTKPRTLVDRLKGSYDCVKTLSCAIRKQTTVADSSVRMLSRVYYSNSDRIHVKNTAPMKRTIVADGTRLFYYEEDMPNGFSSPISELSSAWVHRLRTVPGTNLDHLQKLEGLEEEEFPATDAFPVRKAYRAEHVFVILSCDKEGRLAQLEFYDSPAMKTKLGQYTYSSFVRVCGDCWIPRKHEIHRFLPQEKIQVTETVRVDALRVNEPIADEKFDSTLYFKGVKFSDDFVKALGVEEPVEEKK